MPIQNGSFEDPGARPGEPAGWTITATTSVEDVAAFGDPAVGYEAFDWATPADEILGNALLWDVALFDLIPKTVEEFDDAWGGSYLWEFAEGISQPASIEDFEGGWDNDSPWRASFSDAPSSGWPVSPETWTISTYGVNFDVDGAALVCIFDDPETPSAEGFNGAWTLLDTL